MTRITTTVSELVATIFYKTTVANMNAGTYYGTSIPLRPVPADAVVTLVVLDNGSSIVEDHDGGWIADRFMGAPHEKPSPFGVRVTKAAVKALSGAS